MPGIAQWVIGGERTRRSRAETVPRFFRSRSGSNRCHRDRTERQLAALFHLAIRAQELVQRSVEYAYCVFPLGDEFLSIGEIAL